MKAYKLFRLRKDGTIGPLFINRQQVIEIGTWLPAEAHRTNGFAYRPGWHCCFKPEAPHLKTVLASKEVRVWAEVDVRDACAYPRPESQGGSWILAKKMKVVKIVKIV